MTQQFLTSRIERELAERAGVHAVAEEAGDTIVLSGRVDSAEARRAAEEIAAELAPDKRIDNDLEVEAVWPLGSGDFLADQPSAGPPPAPAGQAPLKGSGQAHAGAGELDPDFTDQPLGTSALEASGVDTFEERDTAYFPPTDPVVTTDSRGNLEVLGGFTPTATSSAEVEPSALDDQPGDEALADAIRRELREDASTTDLRIEVLVRQGVARLRGTVPSLEDAENAEAVAAGVPGVREVIEELTIPDV